MADETTANVNETATGTQTAEPVGTAPKTPKVRKKADATPANTKAAPALKPTKALKVTAKASKVLPVAADAPPRKVRKYTPADRASLLASIEKAIKSGKTTLKAALQQANVGEQTYYNWKNAAAKASPTGKSSVSDDLSALVALEAENTRLRKELATKLRAENAELRRRLGQD